MGIFDSEAAMVLGDKISKTLTWFDNHRGSVHRAADLLAKLGSLPEGGAA